MTTIQKAARAIADISVPCTCGGTMTHDLNCPTRNRNDIQAAAIGRMFGPIVEALESISEYWNGLDNHMAMLDACEHNEKVAREALAQLAGDA